MLLYTRYKIAVKEGRYGDYLYRPYRFLSCCSCRDFPELTSITKYIVGIATFALFLSLAGLGYGNY